ncbi:hypothetical protein OTK49_02530 [Vibrio coralliirubri]|uniref:hypothetical protein n=1 Tax=Vibrio coralliirubri TaxID=1516159 RepID=UPI002284FD51|nr:hypothetical protein [Vibrio coralliirubri]MCY9861393.1 hypothetical protein [Vibrio coralliirubri]
MNTDQFKIDPIHEQKLQAVQERITRLFDKVDASKKGIKSNLIISNINFSHHIKDKHNYLRGVSALKNWREQHKNVLTAAVSHLDDNTLDEPVMELRGIYDDRELFKKMLEELEGSPKTKGAILVEALYAGTLWSESSHPNTIVRGQILKMIGHDPFSSEYEFNCPHCGEKAKTNYDSRFDAETITCAACKHSIKFELIQLNPEQTLEESLASSANPVIKLEAIRLDCWNSVKKDCAELIDEIKECSHLTAIPIIAQKMKIKSVCLSLIPFDAMVPNFKQRREFLFQNSVAGTIYRYVFHYINQLKELDSWVQSPNIRQKQDYSSYRQSRSNPKERLTRLSLDALQSLLENYGIMKKATIPVDSKMWNTINSFMDCTPLCNEYGILNLHFKYKGSNRYPTSYEVIDIDALKCINFTFNESEVNTTIDITMKNDDVSASGASGVSERYTIEEWKQKCKKLVVVYTSMSSKGYADMQLTLEQHGIRDYRTIKLDGFREHGFDMLLDKLDISEGDIILIGRGSGDIKHESFSAFMHKGAMNAIEEMKNMGATVVLGVGNKYDKFPIDESVDYLEDNPKNAATTAAILIKSKV